jgi:hypothetical protein
MDVSPSENANKRSSILGEYNDACQRKEMGLTLFGATWMIIKK